MGDHPRWIKSYYGSYIGDFKPQVVLEGEHKAVVRILSRGAIAYVLVKKRGRHDATAHKALFNGLPDADDIAKMQSQLDFEDHP